MASGEWWNLTNRVLDVFCQGNMPDYNNVSSSNYPPWYNYRGNIDKVVINSSVTNIGTYSFWNCTNLKSITIPDSVTEIKNFAFYGCTLLPAITIPNTVRKIGTGTFMSCAKLASILIPDSITKIQERCFYNCTSLTNISIPNSVTNIGTEAFDGCANLTNISIPNSVTSIGSYAFYGCSNLSNAEYLGTEEEFSRINIGDGNDYLISAVMSLKAERQREEEERKQQMDTELARQYHSITIGAYNTWLNWRLIPTSRPFVNPPEVKTNFVEVPGADGSLDFTEALDGKIHYKDREGSWEFLICHEQIDIDTGNTYHSANRWSILYHDILQAIHGKRLQVILMDEWKEGAEDNRFYVGRVWLNSLQSDPYHSKITFDYVLEPYRYLTTEDAQNRMNGVL